MPDGPSKFLLPLPLTERKRVLLQLLCDQCKPQNLLEPLTTQVIDPRLMYLTSDASAMTTGACITLDDGQTL